MLEIRTSRACALGAALVVAAGAAGVACSPSSSSQCGGPLGPVPGAVGIVYACNLPPPTTVVITGPCEADEPDGIHGVGVGTCVVEIDFPDGLKFSAAIQYTAFQDDCRTYYMPSLNEIVIGHVPMCDEADGEPPQCSCLIDVACDSGALCIDAGVWDGAVYTP